MYEVPLFPLPFHGPFLSLPLTPHPILLPEISFHDVQFGRAMKRPNRIGRANGGEQQSNENEPQMSDDWEIPSKLVSPFT